MSFVIRKAELPKNRGMAQHWDFIRNSRKRNYLHEEELMQRNGLEVNASLPSEVWRDFDAQVRRIIYNDPLLNDLQALARSVNIGKIVSEYRRLSNDDLEVRSSIDGQHAKPVNNTSYDYDGTLILVHSTQVGRNWRELEGMRSEGFDMLVEDQAAAVRYVQKRTVDNFVNGTPGLQYKGRVANGITTNPNTIALDLGAAGLNVDLTSPTTTFEQVRTVFMTALAAVQGQNGIDGDVTFYVSKEIWFNMMRIVNPQVSSTETAMDIILRLPGIAGVKRSDSVTGNKFFAIILRSEYIQPVVGMPVTSTPIARVTPMDDYHVLVWSASGLLIKAGSDGTSGVLYASEA